MQLAANIPTSRNGLLGELSWAFVALVHAWAGVGVFPFEQSLLHHTLRADDQHVAWPLLVAGPALGLVLVSGREWLSYSSDWPLSELDWSAKFRSWFCLLLIVSWLYILCVLIPTVGPGVEGFNTLIMLAFGGLVFTILFYMENRRLLRDIRDQAMLST